MKYHTSDEHQYKGVPITEYIDLLESEYQTHNLYHNLEQHRKKISELEKRIENINFDDSD